MEPSVSSPIQYLKGVGPQLSKTFARKGIRTIEDALYFIPRDYEDRSRLTKIEALSPGQKATVLVRVNSASAKGGGFYRGRGGRGGPKGKRFQALVSDDTGALVLNWFYSYQSLTEEFTPGAELLVYGEVKFFQGAPQISHPEFEPVHRDDQGRPVASLHFGRVVPVYSETEGLTQKVIRRVLSQAVQISLPLLKDPLPPQLLSRLDLPDLAESFKGLHFPPQVPEEETRSPALKRIIFEEFFVLQLGLGLRKRRWRAERAVALKNQEGLQTFLDRLPFSPTRDQSKAIAEICSDIASREAMARLLQGDVGSGKTVVALAAAAVTAGNGYQTAIMAPTELLAQQHYATASEWLSPLGIRVGLVTHHRSDATEKLDVAIGTHALFQKNIDFDRLGLVVVDEQHRFGVDQRNELVKKAGKVVPHLLMMTATPIPRTLSLTLYGDLDLSLLREKPPGRKPVRTRVAGEKQRRAVYETIRETVGEGGQVYIIYPLIEASEKLDLKSATEMYDQLRKTVFPDVSVALLHGRLPGEEKDRILKEFKAGQHRILVSTTVIEVGIDVPNATLMVIEHPERLGLSQLHQLRGRVGRGPRPSQCLLLSSGRVGRRLRVMEQTEDGFVIAEEDLKIRGPGEFLGTRQHGMPGFRAGHILRDAALLELAKGEAQHILETDPDLKKPEHRGIREMVESRWEQKIERLRGG